MSATKGNAKELAKMVGQNIVEKRLSRGITREELAHRLDIIPQSVYKMEVGERFLSAQMMVKVCKALDITYNELFDFDKPDQSSKANLNRLIKLMMRMSEKEVEFVYRFVVELFANFKIRG